MPVLKNARHELFCQALSQGKTQEQAYAEAGYKPSRFNASALKTKQHISKRVAELMSRNIQKQDEIAVISTESLLAEAEAARVKAMKEKGGAAAAIAALTAKAKLAGLWIERAEMTAKTGDLNTMTDAQLLAIIEAGRAQLPAPQVIEHGDPSKLN